MRWILATLLLVLLASQTLGMQHPPSGTQTRAEVSVPAPAKAWRPTRIRQLCNAVAGPGRPPSYPNGFLVVRPPFPGEGDQQAAGLAGALYAPVQVSQAAEYYREYNRLARIGMDAMLNRAPAPLPAAFESAAALTERIERSGVRSSKPRNARDISGNEIEIKAPELAVHLAYLIVTFDQDYAAFAARVERILEIDPSIVERFRFREAGPTRLGARRTFMQVNTDPVRALLLYRLLRRDYSAAENAALYLLESEASHTRWNYYTPYEAPQLTEYLGRTETTMDALAFGGEVAGADASRCSDLYALYVEWLDLSSRAAAVTRDRARLGRIGRELGQLRREVPSGLLGPRYEAARGVIEARVRRAAGM